MSIIVGGAGSGATISLRTTTSLPDYNANYTAMFWAYFDNRVPANEVVYFLGAGGGGTNVDMLTVQSTGRCDVTVNAGSYTSSFNSSTGVLTQDNWHHIALVRESVTSLKLYVDGTLVVTATTDVTGRSTSPSEYYAGTAGSQWATYPDTWVGAWKHWARSMTADEVNREMRQQTPVSYESLSRFYSFRSDHTNTDLAGKGHTTSTTNSPVYTAIQPPVPWDASTPFWVHTAASGGTSVEPGAASLTTTGFAPALAFSLTPGAASLTTTGFAPSLNLSLTPSAASLALTGFAPTVDASGNVSVVPDAASLTLTGYAPLLAFALTPSAASLTLTGFAPSLGLAVTPSPASLTTTGYAPSLGFALTPSTASLVLTGFAPSVVGAVSVEPSPASLVLTGYAPVVTFGTSPIISYGNWSSQVDLLPGEEWTVTLAGPSADAPRARVTLRFTRLTI